ncbi:MAG: DNA-protecting protein DprA [Azospirillum sp.]|nr:DNA-protecting protein DprA [Azospirillum sp.]
MSPQRRALSDAERLDWLRLIRTENVGPITFRRLLERFDTASKALQALPEMSQRGGRAKPLRVLSRAEAVREVDANAKAGARLVALCEPDYPDALATIEDAPPVISVKGHPHLFRRPAVAVVGARNASLNGRRFTLKLAQELGAAGYLVVSGLARGIDTAAHEGALTQATCAVLAGGIDVVYPEENAGLYQSIAERGVIVAEVAIGTQPQARHFPRRNRLISGLSLGVVVVEAAPRSGSLITARCAGEQGRIVLAVPGSPLDPRCQGTNGLIREGAVLVQSADDVIAELRGMAPPRLSEPQLDLFAGPPRSQPDQVELERARALIVENLSPTPVPIDELIRGCQLSAPVVLTVVLELELAGRVQRQPGNQVSLI